MSDSESEGSGQSAPVYQGLLLLGPTGSGKTPLGELLAQQGVWGRRCVHFDFGAQLRRIASGSTCGTVLSPPPVKRESSAGDLGDSSDIGRSPESQQEEGGPFSYFTPQEREFVQQVLQRGALLEDAHFPLALKILKWFLVVEGVETPDVLHQTALPLTRSTTGSSGERWIVLNGLPRHVGQAEALRPWIDVQAVIHLECPAEVVLERIRTNVGGDRQGRTDDAVASVQAKLAIYTARTQPLIDYYQGRGVPIVRLPVTAVMTPGEAWAQLQRKNPW
ncbi:MAG TPA: nucleoside monophosphate kinase, partial [Thermoguttaceae bacterium]|nr:nucleoside monophosphate kinase [Thermoguttaceae bacterium]